MQQNSYTLCTIIFIWCQHFIWKYCSLAKDNKRCAKMMACLHCLVQSKTHNNTSKPIKQIHVWKIMLLLLLQTYIFLYYGPCIWNVTLLQLPLDVIDNCYDINGKLISKYTCCVSTQSIYLCFCILYVNVVFVTQYAKQ